MHFIALVDDFQKNEILIKKHYVVQIYQKDSSKFLSFYFERLNYNEYLLVRFWCIVPTRNFQKFKRSKLIFSS